MIGWNRGGLYPTDGRDLLVWDGGVGVWRRLMFSGEWCWVLVSAGRLHQEDCMIEAEWEPDAWAEINPPDNPA